MCLVRAVLICAVLGLTTGKVNGSGSSAKIFVVKAVGDDVVLKPRRDPAPYTDLSWIFDDKGTIISVNDGVNSTDPEYVDRITLFANGSLELRNLTLKDSGIYRVNITSTVAPEFIHVFSLGVQEPVSNVSFTASATDVIEGDVVKLLCSGSGTDVLFKWYNQSQNMGFDYSVDEISRTVTRYDTGPFLCEVSNAVSKVPSEEVILTISYGPDVYLSAYTKGSTVTLTCRVDSKPEAEITWTHDETPLPFNGTELVLQDIKYSLNGRYTCTAYNPKTNIRRSDSRDICVGCLSVGAMVGIALACVAVVGGAAGGLAYVCFRKRKRTP